MLNASRSCDAHPADCVADAAHRRRLGGRSKTIAFQFALATPPARRVGRLASESPLVDVLPRAYDLLVASCC